MRGDRGTVGEVEAPVPLSESVRARMKAQARAKTRPEQLLRRELWRRGLRYRVAYPVPGNRRRSIDIAFTRALVAVFVDGCFWHRCPVHAVPVKNNAAWWTEKLDANVARDRDTDEHLRSLGWAVHRFWEHEDMGLAAATVQEAVIPDSTTSRS